MDEIFQFWKNTTLWPDDAYGFVFFSRALQRIGTALFNDEWTGTEVVTAGPIETWHDIVSRIPPSRISQARQQYHRDLAALIASADPSKLTWIAEKYRVLTPLRTVPSLGRLSFGHLDDGTRTRQVLSDESRLYGESLIPQENQRRIEARDRWTRVVALAKDALRDGRLEYVTLPTHGGAFSVPRPKEWWNVSNIGNRLAMCRMNPAAPYGAGVAGNGYEHIFVKESDLERVLPAPPKPKTSTDVKDIYARISQLYDKLEREGNGLLTREAFQKACKDEERVKSTIAREVFTLKRNGDYEKFALSLKGK